MLVTSYWSMTGTKLKQILGTLKVNDEPPIPF